MVFSVLSLCQLETIDAKGAVAMPFDTRIAPTPPTQPVLNVPPVVLGVVGVLVAVHVLFWALGQSWQVWSLYALSFIPARLGGGQPIPYPQGAQLWSFFTYALLHADVFHLGSNCLWLLIFSTPVARRMGAWRYLLLLAGSAVAGAAAMLLSYWGAYLVVIGASASVSATLAAAIPIMFAPGFRMGASNRVDYENLRVLQPSQLMQSGKALVFAAVFLAMTLFTGASMALTGTAFLEERNIAWEAHLGGFIAGLILFYLLDKKPFRN
jgi:membrane associated rhomboid family serine protease